MTEKKESRPSTIPIPVRFTDEMVKEIQDVAQNMSMSQQDIIRLSVTAGLQALKKIGYEGLAEKISEEIISPTSKEK